MVELTPPTSSADKLISKDFPLNLEGQLEAVLSSFNITTKATTLLLLQRRMVTPNNDLNNSFRAVYTGSSIQFFHDDAAIGYAQKSLCDIGLVAAAVRQATLGGRNGESVYGFTTTDEGENLGKPIAAAFLKFEAENNMSLAPIFSSSGRRDEGFERPPLTRARILLQLLKGTQTLSQIAEQTGITRMSMSHILPNLRTAGVIDYSSLDRQGQIQVTYKFKTDPQKFFDSLEGRTSFSSNIMRACVTLTQQGIEVSQRNVFDYLFPNNEEFDAVKLKHLRSEVAEVFSRMKNSEVLERNNFIGREVQSEAKLTEKGKKVVEGLLLPLIDCLKGGATLELWRTQVLPEVKNNLGQYARVTGELFYPHSKSAKMANTENTKGAICLMLTKAAKESVITSDTISRELGMPKGTVNEYIRQLEQSGTVHRTKRRGFSQIALN